MKITNNSKNTLIQKSAHKSIQALSPGLKEVAQKAPAQLARLFGLLIITTALAACGGGGGGSTPPPSSKDPVPAVPTNIRMEDATGTSIKFLWDPVDNATHYQVYRDDTRIAASISDTNYTDTGLEPNTSYGYRVAACDSNNTCSEPSTTVSIPTLPGLLNAKMPEIRVGSAAPTSLTVSWDPIDFTEYYKLYRDGTRIGGNIRVPATSYIDSNLTFTTEYSYRLISCNIDQCSEESDPVNGTTLTEGATAIPALPTNIRVGDVTATSLTISWDSVTDATHYRVYLDSPRVGVVNISTTSYTDTGLDPNSLYSYRIDACNSDDLCSVLSALVSARTLAEGAVPVPAAPTNIRVGDATPNSLTISWDPVTDATSYRAYRNGDRIGGNISTTNYPDTALSSNTTYSYRIDACNSDDLCSVQSAPVSGMTLAEVVQTPAVPEIRVGSAAPTSLTVSWDPIDFTEYYKLYRNGTRIGGNIRVPATSYIDSNLTFTTEYSYRLISCNIDQCSQESDPVNGMTLAEGATAIPALPTNIRVADATATSLTISWDPVTDAVYYRVYRGVNRIEDRVSATSYTDTELSSNTEYTYSLDACNSDNLCSAKSEAMSARTLLPVPAAPEISVADATPNSLTISWDPVADAVYYRVYRGVNRIEDRVSATSYTDTGLSSATDYEYTIDACNSDNLCSVQSEAMSAMTSAATVPPPVVPAISSVGDATATSLNVSWDPVDNATYYRVYLGDIRIEDRVSATSYTDTGLDPNSLYSYRIDACNSEGACSVRSALVSAMTLLSTPTNIRVADATATSLNVSWDSVTGATHYQVYRDGTRIGVNISTTNYIDNGLDSGEEYGYRVDACNSDDLCSAQSAPVNGRTLAEGAVPVPAVPTNIRVADATPNSLNVSWDPVTGATHYQVYRDSTMIGGDISTTNYIDNGLDSGEEYGYGVAACNESGCSNRSDPVSGMTLAAAPSVPSISSVGDATPTSLLISWDRLFENFSYYQLYRNGTRIGVDITVATSYTDTDLTPNSLYSYRIEACNSDGLCSVLSAPVSGTTLAEVVQTPDVPTNIRGEDETGTSIKFLWDPVDNATHYQVYRDGTRIGGNVTTTSYTDTGLTPNNSYGYRVAACDSNNTCSEPSTTVSLLTFIGLLNAETPEIRVGSAAPTSLTVSWDPIDFTEYYKLYRNGTRIGGNIRVPATSYIDSNLTFTTEYSYTLISCNIDQCSQESDPVNGMTLAEGATAIPALPTNIRVGNVTATSLNVSWDPVDTATHYRVYLDSPRVGVVNISTTNYTDTALTPNTTYTYRVDACNSDNLCSVLSGPVSARTLLPAPTNIRVADLTPTSLTISWDSVTDATHYNISRNGEVIADTIPVTAPSPSYTDTTPMIGNDYTYMVRACNAVGCSVARSVTVNYRVPAQPTGLTANILSGSINLTWTAVDDTTHYEISRDGGVIAGTVTLMVPNTAINYEDTSGAEGLFSYAVSACNAVGCSVPASTRVSFFTDAGDADSDGVSNSDDVDVDGDGLIEIYTAQELNATRNNLRGTALDLTNSEGDNRTGGNDNGCGNNNDITSCNGYELMADIDLNDLPTIVGALPFNGGNWIPLGCGLGLDCFDLYKFNAIFEGNGNSVRNMRLKYLNINQNQGVVGVGFFGGVISGKEIRNLHLIGASIISPTGSLSDVPFFDQVGGLVGDGDGVIITSSSVIADTLEGRGGDIGGLLGSGNRSKITNSFAIVQTIANDESLDNDDTNFGGLVGSGIDATIIASAALFGKIATSDDSRNSGGLVGNAKGADIRYSFVAADRVQVNFTVGGLAGLSDNDLQVSYSYAATSVVFGSKNSMSGDAFIGLLDTVEAPDDTSGVVLDGPINYNASKIVDSYFDSRVKVLERQVGLSPVLDSDTSHPEPEKITASTAQLQGSDTTGNIFANWGGAWCDTTTGEFTTNASTSFSTDENLVWNFGTNEEYPAINCFPTLRPAEQQLLADIFIEGGGFSSITSIPHSVSQASADSIKWFWINLDESATDLAIFTEGTSSPSATLYSADGTELASNSDGGIDNNFRITRSLDAGVSYYLKIEDASTEADSSYQLKLE